MWPYVSRDEISQRPFWKVKLRFGSASDTGSCQKARRCDRRLSCDPYATPGKRIETEDLILRDSVSRYSTLQALVRNSLKKDEALTKVSPKLQDFEAVSFSSLTHRSWT